jgi:hypothetical protein
MPDALCRVCIFGCRPASCDMQSMCGRALVRTCRGRARLSPRCPRLSRGAPYVPPSAVPRQASRHAGARCADRHLLLGGRRAFEHFCMHTGGRGVLDAMEQQLRLPARMMQPSRAALWRCGAPAATTPRGRPAVARAAHCAALSLESSHVNSTAARSCLIECTLVAPGESV